MQKMETAVKKLWGLLALIAMLLAPLGAMAQSTAMPVTPGYLTTSGCPTGVTACFVAYGAAGQAITTNPSPVAANTDLNSTVATGGAYQQLLAASATRKSCLVQNPTTATEPLLIEVDTVMTGPFYLAPGAVFSCATGAGGVLTNKINVSAATTGHAFTGTAVQ